MTLGGWLPAGLKLSNYSWLYSISSSFFKIHLQSSIQNLTNGSITFFFFSNFSWFTVPELYNGECFHFPPMRLTWKTAAGFTSGLSSLLPPAHPEQRAGKTRGGWALPEGSSYAGLDFFGLSVFPKDRKRVSLGSQRNQQTYTFRTLESGDLPAIGLMGLVDYLCF